MLLRKCKTKPGQSVRWFDKNGKLAVRFYYTALVNYFNCKLFNLYTLSFNFRLLFLIFFLS